MKLALGPVLAAICLSSPSPFNRQEIATPVDTASTTANHPILSLAVGLIGPSTAPSITMLVPIASQQTPPAIPPPPATAPPPPPVTTPPPITTAPPPPAVPPTPATTTPPATTTTAPPPPVVPPTPVTTTPPPTTTTTTAPPPPAVPPTPVTTTPPPAAPSTPLTTTVTITLAPITQVTTVTITTTITMTVTSTSLLPAQPTASTGKPSQATDVFWAISGPKPSYNDVNWVATILANRPPEKPKAYFRNPRRPAPLSLENNTSIENPAFSRIRRPYKNRPPPPQRNI
ncbi:hypothetical protein DSO57_1035677 [Entomophthora muscae]|uniref:Uncharacterized protein n=1 Tax=Entomophthora muscae TaxID=34485 RepID=A0ACC2TXB1_9FUNG|nr:hypothetical protein DSO57_1035677 [Entomophthora muscae]